MCVFYSETIAEIKKKVSAAAHCIYFRFKIVIMFPTISMSPNDFSSCFEKRGRMKKCLHYMKAASYPSEPQEKGPWCI